MKTVNPATGQIEKSYETIDNEGINEVLERSNQAFSVYSKSSFSERVEKILSVERVLLENKDRFASLMTKEMGKLYSASVAEVEKCASLCRYYAENGEAFLSDDVVKTDAKSSYIRYLPIGPVLAVMPWNFPFWQVFRFAVPALMAGNVALLKHASNVPGCALAIEDIFIKAGFKNHEFQTLMIGSDKVAEIIEDRRVRAVTLTGSEGAGRAVAQQAGKVIKKSVLELGGSDPFIVMPSADLDQAVKLAVQGRLQNNGQTCIAAKRYIVHEDIYEEFSASLMAAYAKVKVGDPMDEGVGLGPLATANIRDELTAQVEETVHAGAHMLYRSQIPVSEGFYFPVMLLEDVPPKTPAYDDELFGPVGLLFKVSSIEQAVDLANDTRFGLGSVICTQDEGDKAYAVQHIEAGATFINAITASDVRMPFGGVKDSGYGRELTALGMREFMNIKTVVER